MDTSKINKSLWEKIGPYYDKELYADALRTACLFVLDVIKEKSDIDKDGEKLIQEVFLGKNPKIIINKYSNESERDEQRGFGLILQGLVCSVRNPISHELTYSFDKDMTDSIIMYINNYILKKLNNSKEFSYVENWFEFIMDKNYIENDEYVQLVIDNMTQLQKYNTIIDTLKLMYRLNDNNRSLTIHKIISSLNSKYYAQLIEYLNKLLINYSDDNELRQFLSNFPATLWKDLNKIVTIRIENMIYNSIVEGRTCMGIDGKEKILGGSLGTWINIDFLNAFSNKNKILNELKRKLDVDKQEGRYVTKYLENIILESDILQKEEIIRKLSIGNINYYTLFRFDLDYQSYIDKFVEKEIDPFADMLE